MDTAQLKKQYKAVSYTHLRYIGGGHKKKFRLVDFKREKDGVPAVVKSIEYLSLIHISQSLCWLKNTNGYYLLLIFSGPQNFPLFIVRSFREIFVPLHLEIA